MTHQTINVPSAEVNGNLRGGGNGKLSSFAQHTNNLCKNS